ncbi:hypothetical protein PAXRUDRAFT_129036, partial [Paxillus rubicundulus Ve08.2h10]
GSFLIRFGCQLHGILTGPDAVRYLDLSSPAAFFAMQVVLQLYWIKKPVHCHVRHPSPKYERRVSLPGGRPSDTGSTRIYERVAYAPIYALGNPCIGDCLDGFLNERVVLGCSDMVSANTFIQFYAVYYLLGTFSPFAPSKYNVSTHLVAKTLAGIAVLDFIDEGAVAAARVFGPPSVPVQTLTVILFTLLVCSHQSGVVVSGLCIFYDVLAMAAGLLMFVRLSYMWRRMASIQGDGASIPVEHG